ncbi:MAG: hypothetical protein ACYS15_02160 [Planctomycetota bacterium]|jgi:hypothetical protein
MQYLIAPTSAALAACLVCGLGAAQADKSGTPLPIGAQAMPDAVNTVWLYKNANHSGQEQWINLGAGSHAPGTPHRIEGALHDQVSSLRWHLEDGVVLVLFADGKGIGQQISIWGHGEMGTLGPWNLKDKLSSWGWYRVGGTGSSASDLPVQATTLTTAIEEDSVRLYDDKNFRKEAGSLRSITSAAPQGTVQELDRSIHGNMTSTRWNLPPGVVVVLYEKLKGTTGRQLALWGSGEYASVSDWKFNDQARAWAWFRVGEAPTAQQPLANP